MSMRLYCILLSSFLLASQSHAHAHLKEAIPKANALIETKDSPQALSLNFSEGIELAYSKVEVRESLQQGKLVPEGKLSSPQKSVLMLNFPAPLKAGRYFVVWAVTSVDRHKTNGHYSFLVK